MPEQPQPAAQPPTISLRWLVTALAITLLFAGVCWYGALCLLFYQGQWQLLFHPSRTISATPDSAGIPYQETHFAASYNGPPLLDGWSVPAAPESKYVTDTVLYLHDVRGSLSDCVPALATLHATGINVFAVDYRGFGRSAAVHPTERTLNEDAGSVWIYLTDELKIPPSHVIVFGDGVGATLAAHLAARFAPAGIILEDPNPSARQILLSDARARLLPLWLLQNEKLDPSADLAASHIPRLFLDVHSDSTRIRELFDLSSYPKQYFDLRSSPASALAETLRRFFDDVALKPNGL
jgi:pimeloyl-ACP methyl ester carboxylesterase